MKSLKKFASKLYLLPIGLVIMLSSCKPYYHYPTYQHVPTTNTKAHEFQIIGFSDGYNKGYSAGYSFTKSFGAFVTHNQLRRKDAKITDFGVYYYRPIEYTYNEDFKLTVASSLSYGKGKWQFYNFDLNMDRVAIQPSISGSSKFLDWGLSNKISIVNYTVDYRRKLNQNSKQEYEQKFKEKAFVFNELNSYIGVGYKWIKLNLNFVSLQEVNEVDFPYTEFAIYPSLNINSSFSEIFKKKNQ